MATPTVLAFDTSAAHCAAALLLGNEIVAAESESMSKGQSERLFPLLEKVLETHGAVWEELDAVGVGVGPGNFTGTRISVSAARGLSLSLGVPAIGISSFAVTRSLLNASYGRTMTVLPGPRDQWLWEYTNDAGQPIAVGLAPREAFCTHGHLEGGPGVIGPFDLDDLPSWEQFSVSGHVVDLEAPTNMLNAFSEKIAPEIARLSAAKLMSGTAIGSPAPLYVRAADAAPSRTVAPEITS